MADCGKREAADENVAENWEEVGDEVSVQLEQRQKQILKRKQKEEELAKAREAAMEQSQQCCSGGEDRPSGFKILQRPQSCGTLPSSSKESKPKVEEMQQNKQKSLEERQAAYQQARERIFGDYNPENEPEEDLGPTIVPLPPATANSPTNLMHPNMYSVPIPRPRASVRTIRTPLFQPIPPNHGLGYALPPPLSMQSPMTYQQRLHMMGPANPIPFYDARIPPPPPVHMFPIPNIMTAPVRDSSNNPVPYGRPPAQLLSQNQFSSHSSSTNHNF